MSHTPAHWPKGHLRDEDSLAVLARAETLLAQVTANLSHPAATLTGHVLDLHLAAAVAVLHGADNSISLQAGSGILSHICEWHALAAMYLLGCSVDDGMPGAVQLMDGAQKTIDALLADG